MITIVGFVVGLWVLAYGLPDLFWHHLQWGSFQGSRDSHKIALTFDDGPGQDTAAILDVLAAHQAKATFFIVVEAAERHPDLIQRMVRDGHTLGLHGVSHRSMYLETPWASVRTIRQGARLLENLTGQPLRYYRPPWGHVNLFSWWAWKKFGLVPVFWTIAPDDWNPLHNAEMIYRTIVQCASPGSIVVLHDGGGDRQPTIAALDKAIGVLRKLNLEPVNLDSMPMDASELRRMWTWWEMRFTQAWDIDTVPSSLGGDPVLRLGHIQYKGSAVTFAEGTQLVRGTPMAEIHFGNPALAQLSKNATGGLRAFHAVLRSLTDVAQFVETSEKYRDVQAVGGITLLDASSAIEKLGFLRIPIRGWQKWSMWFYLAILMSVYHTQGWRTLKRFFKLQPVLLVMSRKHLEDRYLRRSKEA
ncbi:MAG: polysaccharide deacetylase family protein [Sulfobacillus sp.]